MEFHRVVAIADHQKLVVIITKEMMINWKACIIYSPFFCFCFLFLEFFIFKYEIVHLFKYLNNRSREGHIHNFVV